jgi:hypothetical protein
MNGKLPEEKLNELLPGLGRLAELVSAGETLDRHALRSIASDIGIDGEEWALVELELWSRILLKCKDTSHPKDTIVTELRSRGIPEFPAMLAYDLAKPKPMMVEPPFIDFGCLKIGEGASTTLKVSGERVSKVVSGRRLKVTLLDAGPATTLVKVQISNGAASETVKDEVVLRGSTSELRIPVTARWEAEPALLSWCPICGDKIKKKSLFYNTIAHKYECLNLACKHEFPYPDKSVNQYNDTHK